MFIIILGEPMQGRYVIVQMNNGEDGLHLKEVTAFGFNFTTSTETPSSTSKESATTSKCQ